MLSVDWRLAMNLLRFTFLVLAVGMLVACGKDGSVSPSGEEGEIQTGYRRGLRPPDFNLNTIDGHSVRLHSLLGSPIFLNFWSTQCGPCVAEMPDLEKLQQTLGGQIQIIGVNLRESADQVGAFLQANGLTWTFVLDTTGSVAASYAVTAIPTSIFISAKGVITHRYVGGLSYASMRLLALEAIEGN